MSEKLREWHRAEAVAKHPVVIEEHCRHGGCEADILRASIGRLESTLDQARAELDSLRAWKRSVDEALNSGDGAYRP